MQRPRTRLIPWLGLASLAWVIGGCPEEDPPDADEQAKASAPPAQPMAEAPEPPPVPRPRHPLLALGAAHTCLAEPGGPVRCWGSNRFGQLGAPEVPRGPGASRATPVEVEGLADVTALTAGAFHTCALRRDGGVLCWGHGVHAARAMGDHAPRTDPASDSAPHRWPGRRDVPVPQRVEGVQGAAALAAGEGFTCALVAGNDVECWGRNDLGQLGRGSAGAPGGVGEVVGVAGADAVVAGRQHACALVSGTVRCWGMAVDGQLGDSVGSAFVVTPVSVALPGPAEVLSAGGYHTCALVAGRVHCFGANDSGQLGTDDGGRPDDRRAEPEPMVGVDAVRSVAAGARFTCVIADGGRVACAGYNAHGQLGDGNTAQRRVAVEVEDLTDVTILAAGAAHACAIDSGGTLWCWGRNGVGQLGDGTTEDRHAPVTVER